MGGHTVSDVGLFCGGTGLFCGDVGLFGHLLVWSSIYVDRYTDIYGWDTPYFRVKHTVYLSETHLGVCVTPLCVSLEWRRKVWSSNSIGGCVWVRHIVFLNETLRISIWDTQYSWVRHTVYLSETYLCVCPLERHPQTPVCVCFTLPCVSLKWRRKVWRSNSIGGYMSETHRVFE